MMQSTKYKKPSPGFRQQTALVTLTMMVVTTTMELLKQNR